MSLLIASINYNITNMTASFFSMAPGTEHFNVTDRVTFQTVTMVTNGTNTTATLLPNVETGRSRMGLVLVPIGVVTIIALTVAMVLYIRKRKRLEKLRHQLMPMYNFDPAEEQDELEQELLDHGRDAAAQGLQSKVTPSTANYNTTSPKLREQHHADWHTFHQDPSNPKMIEQPIYKKSVDRGEM